MNKILALEITLLLVLTFSLPVLAAEESVPIVPVGAYMEGADYGDDEKAETPALTDEERQLRIDAYNEILALSQTDDNITEVRLSKDSRWVFLAPAGDPVTIEHMSLTKEYAQKFEQYTAFLILTDADNIDRIEDDFASNSGPVEAGGLDGGAAVTRDNYLWIIVFGVLIFGSGFVFMQRKGLIPALQTTNGTVITQNTAISKKETVFAVKQNETAPDSKVFDSILSKIDKE